MLKKAILTLSLLLFAGASFAFIDQRSAWWSLRIDELTETKENIQSGAFPGIDRGITVLLDREIVRGRETLELMKKTGVFEPRRVSNEELRADIHAILMPLYSLCSLEAVLTGCDDVKTAALAENAAEKLAGTKLRLSRGEKNQLSLETVLSAVLRRFDSRYRETAAAIETAVARKAEAGDSLFDPDELRDFIREKAVSLCEMKSGINEDEIEAAIPLTWSYKNITASLERTGKLRRETGILLEKAGVTMPDEKLDYFTRNIHSLDRIYFEKKSRDGISRYNSTVNSKARNASEHPALRLPEFRSIIATVDAHRRNILAGITGRETDAFFSAAETRLNSAATEKTREAEKRLAACDKNECGTASDRLDARKALDLAADLAGSYAGDSLDFIRRMSLSRSVDGDSITADFRYRAAVHGAYLNFIRSLAEKSGGIALLKTREHHPRYASAVRGLSRLFPRLGSSFTVEREILPFLGKEGSVEIRKIMADFKDALRNGQAAVSASYDAFNKRTAALDRKKSASESRLDTSLARYDMDRMTETLADYSSFYATLTYPEKALDQYRDAYKRLESGEDLPRRRDSVLKTGSLIPYLDGFDITRIRSERETKNFLKKEIRALTARLSALENLYRLHGISIPGSVTRDESPAILEILNKNPRVLIGDWKMDETNITDIDKKAIQKLALSAMKRDWRPSHDGDNPGAAGARVKIESPSLAFTLPSGWAEVETKTYHNERGIFKIYGSRDETASVELVKIEEPGSPLNELSIEWHKRIGSRVVKGKWGRKGEMDYYWTISKDRSNHIRESYTFNLGNGAMIISGLSPRDRYGFFTKKMEGMINSLAR